MPFTQFWSCIWTFFSNSFKRNIISNEKQEKFKSKADTNQLNRQIIRIISRSFYILAFSFFTSWWLFTLPFISLPASAFNSSKLMFLSPFPFCGTPLVAIPGPSLCSLTSHTVFLFLLFSKLYFVISDRIYIIASHRWCDAVAFVGFFFIKLSRIILFSQLYNWLFRRTVNVVFFTRERPS